MEAEDVYREDYIMNSNSFLIYTISLLLCHCGVYVGNPTDSDTESDKSSSTPVDTTGESSEVTLTVSSSSGLSLQSNALTISDNITIDLAVINIGRLRFAANSEETEHEQNIDTYNQNFEQSYYTEKESDRNSFTTEYQRIEAEYDALISQASSEEDKERLRDEEDQARESLESNYASFEDTLESQLFEYEETEDDTLKLKDSYSYDLIANTITPEIQTISTLDGSYPRIEIQILPLRQSSQAKLLNRSIVIEGTWKDSSGTSRHFEFESRSGEEIILLSDNSFTVSPNDSNRLLIKFPVGAWFEGIDLENASLSRGGEIRITDSQNTAIYQQIIDNITNSARYGADADQNGDLDDTEALGDGRLGRSKNKSSLLDPRRQRPLNLRAKPRN